MTIDISTKGIEITGPMNEGFDEILTDKALAFLAGLQRKYNTRRKELLVARAERQKQFDAGTRPDFLPETADVRAGDWTIGPLPEDLKNRRVEITGPVDRKMIINALNSGAKMFMADCEDSSCPTWTNMVEGQINLRDAVRRTISFEDAAKGKSYKLNDQIATLIVRPRGWHLEENHVLVDGAPISGSIFDFGLYFFHNVEELLKRGSGPYFYLPKMESHLDARLWNDIFVDAQKALGVPNGTIKATVLIETITAAFEMDEILYELRDHSAGLNCGRWDYIFSYIKKFGNDANMILPDRAQVTMTVPMMRNYSLLAIKTCHKRNAPAIGGMAAFIPIKSDAEANDKAINQVKADKEREATDGHDGSWVAHPGLVPIAMEIFDRVMPQPNQIDRQRDDVEVTAADLLAVPEGTYTEAGLRQNIAVGIAYVEAWLRGIGCVPLFNLMEDAATAEISRAQVWQWLKHGITLEDGRTVTRELVETTIVEELLAWKERVGEDFYASAKYEQAASIFRTLVYQDEFTEFLTLPAYDAILEAEKAAA
ncbi:MAG: malate synthase A [Alphaproteobacteria bacterium]